jgi:hypothetical protein
VWNNPNWKDELIRGFQPRSSFAGVIAADCANPDCETTLVLRIGDNFLDERWDSGDHRYFNI